MPATKPKTKASLTERLDALIQEAASIVEEVEQNAKDALVTAEAEVWEAHRRFGSARGELVKSLAKRVPCGRSFLTYL